MKIHQLFQQASIGSQNQYVLTFKIAIIRNQCESIGFAKFRYYLVIKIGITCGIFIKQVICFQCFKATFLSDNSGSRYFGHQPQYLEQPV